MSSPVSPPGPLAGVTVVDLTRVLSGPYCTMMLADFGARVVKVEHPARGDDTRGWGPPFVAGESAYFLSVNRNKESMTLDFKTTDGRRILERLIAAADVLVENFRPGTLAGAGFDAGRLLDTYPQLIYCAVSGFGQTGPRRDEPGYDAVMQAEGGLMSITGDPGGPPFRLGVAISDIVSGMWAAYGILAALHARAQTGRGQQVDVGMLDATVSLLTYQAGICFATGQAPPRLGNRHPTIVPYESFPTSDGDLVVAIGNDAIWQRFCAAAEAPDLAADPRFAANRDRVTHYDVIKPRLDAVFRQRSRQDWIERLAPAGVPCGSVRDVQEVLRDPQTAARGMVQALSHPVAGDIRVTGVPAKLSATPGAVRTAPPTLGQHTDAVLAELGCTPDDIASLRDRRVV
jgi:crotonobetainyl-CoA:carnitine CoA-transferase CaiB-like acyl-CoA transferase